MKALKCTDTECKKILKKTKYMSFAELEKFNTKCATCGDWIFKEQKIANETYNAVSTKWAEEFMKKIFQRS